VEEYEKVIRELFAMLAVANRADSDDHANKEWQLEVDASQRHGFFGHIANAIVSIAGQRIFDYWAETAELDITLASRCKP
jgi:hypothetical protein